MDGVRPAAGATTAGSLKPHAIASVRCAGILAGELWSIMFWVQKRRIAPGATPVKGVAESSVCPYTVQMTSQPAALLQAVDAPRVVLEEAPPPGLWLSDPIKAHAQWRASLALADRS